MIFCLRKIVLAQPPGFRQKLPCCFKLKEITQGSLYRHGREPIITQTVPETILNMIKKCLDEIYISYHQPVEIPIIKGTYDSSLFRRGKTGEAYTKMISTEFSSIK
jgi:hypothetical protein